MSDHKTQKKIMEKPVCAQQLSEALGNTQGKPPGRIWESICESCKGVRPLCDECVEIRRKKTVGKRTLNHFKKYF